MPRYDKLKSFIKPLLSIFQSQGVRIGNQVFTKELERTAGFEFQRENPDVLLQDKNETVDLYDTMLLDDRVSMATNLKKRITLSIPADIIPVSDSDLDKEVAEDIENQLMIKKQSIYRHTAGYSFWSMVDNLMDAMSYGYKVGEKVFSMQNNRVVLSNIKFKHSRFYDFDYDKFANLDTLVIGRRFGHTKQIDGISKIENKWLLGVYPYPKDGNFYGQSELMQVFPKWRSKLHIQKQRDIFIERWGSPIPEATYVAEETTEAEVDAMRDLLDNFQEGTYLLNPGKRNVDGVINGKIDFKIHEVKKGTGSQMFTDAIDQIDKQITRAILFPDKLGFSESPGGAYNQAETQLEILLVVIEYLHQWIEGVINPLIRQLVDFNFVVKDYPVLKFDKISDKIKADMLNTLIQAGVVDPKEKWIRKHVGIPTITPEEEEQLEEAKEERRQKSMEEQRQRGGFDDNLRKPNENNNPRIEDEEGIPDDKIPVKNAAKLKKDKDPFDARGTKKFFNEQEAEFQIEFEKIMFENTESVINQIERRKIIENKDIREKRKLAMPKTELKQFLTQKFSQWYFTGRKDSIDEILPRLDADIKFKKIIFQSEGITTVSGELPHSHSYRLDDTGNGRTLSTDGEGDNHVHEITNFIVQGAGLGNHTHDLDIQLQANFKTEIDWLDKKFIDRFLGKSIFGKLTAADITELKIIRDKGFQITGIEEEKLLKDINFIIDSGIRSGLTGAEVASQIREKSALVSEAQSLTIARTNISDFYNTARLNTFTEKPLSQIVEAYEYQAIIDDATTPFCREHDGQVIKSGDGAVAQINPPNHFNCRSVLVPILIGDKDDPDSFYSNYPENTEPFGTNITEKAVNPEIGFGGTGNK